MVTAWLLLATLAAPGAPLGVVQVARDVPGLSPGHVLGRDAAIATGGSGWIELTAVGGVRVRVSAGTRLRLGGAPGALRIDVATGRIWVQRDATAGAVEVRLGGRPHRVAPRTSAVLEQTASGGALIAVQRGEVVGEAAVGAGRIARRPPGAPALRVQAGGAALLDLAADEARLELLDPAGWQAFLLERARLDAARARRAVGPRPRFTPDVLGSDAGPEGALVEEALRPPPFFEEEVPPKGPNVDVEVRFPEAPSGG